MNRQKLINGLQFENHRTFNNHIHSKTAMQLDSLVRDRKVKLALKPQPALAQLIAEALFINRFQPARPGNAMHFDGRANDRFGRSIGASLLRNAGSLCPLCDLRF